MNPIAEVLGAAPTGVEVRLSRPQQASGQFQQALDRARRALRERSAAPQSPEQFREAAADDERPASAGESSESALRPEPGNRKEAGKPVSENDGEGEAFDRSAGSAGRAVDGALRFASALPVHAALEGAHSGTASVVQTGGMNSTPEVQGVSVAADALARQVGEPSPDGGALLRHHAGQATSGTSDASSDTPGIGQLLGQASKDAALTGQSGGLVGTDQPATARESNAFARGHGAIAGRGIEGAQSVASNQASGTMRPQAVDPLSAGEGRAEAPRAEVPFALRADGLENASIQDVDVSDQAPIADRRTANPAETDRPDAARARSGEPGATGEAEARVEAREASRSDEGARTLQRQGGGADTVRAEPSARAEAATPTQHHARAQQAYETGRSTLLSRPGLQQMIRGAEAHFGEEVSTLRLQLKPANLGDLDLRLSVEHGVLTAKFVAHSHEVKALIESALPDLRQSLQEQGVAVEQLTVSVGDPGERRSENGGQGAGSRVRAGVSRKGPAVEAPASGAVASSPRMWYSQGVDVLV